MQDLEAAVLLESLANRLEMFLMVKKRLTTDMAAKGVGSGSSSQ